MLQPVSAPTRQLAQWIATLRYEDIPTRTLEVVRGSLLDTLGAGVHGFGTPWAQKLLAWARQDAVSNGRARVWGEAGPSLGTANAALVNGSAAHAFELDDYHNSKIHPGAVVIAAAMAIAEARNADGKALLTAVVAGYEAMIRTSLALNPSAARLRGWHLTGVTGTLGAAAACASLMQLDAEHTAWALGLAGTQSSGTWAFNADGTQSKRFHPGRAAQSGVMAVELAAMDFTGPTQIYEFEDGGILKAFSDASDASRLNKDLGRVWHTDTTSIKPYSCCGSTHAYIDAALALRKKLGSPWNAQRGVRVGTSKVVDVQCGFDYTPGTVLNAQMSLRYAVAAALLDGQVLPGQFTDERMAAPDVVKLSAHLELVPDPRLDELYPANFAGWVAAENNGRWERVDIMNPTGSSDVPIDLAGVENKLRGIDAGLPLERIVPAIRKLESQPVREFLGLFAVRK